MQRHVTATKRRVEHTEATCIRVVKRVHVVGTKSQHLHTHENVAGTCIRDMLQRHDITDTFVTVQHQLGSNFVLAERDGTGRGDKIIPKLVLHSY